MRSLMLIALGASIAVAGCGQKGPLVRPTRSSTTPVVIRSPAPADEAQAKPDADAPKR